MMTEEIYFLVDDRSLTSVESFLNQFLPHRENAADPPFPYPELSPNPFTMFESEIELIRALANDPREIYGLYWRSNSSFRRAMAFFTNDGKIIFGIADSFPDRESAMHEIAGLLGATCFRFGWEQRPPDSAGEFEKECFRAGNSDSHSSAGNSSASRQQHGARDGARDIQISFSKT